MTANRRTPTEQTEQRERIRRELEAELATVTTPEAAEAIVRQLERLTAGETEDAVAAKVARSPEKAATAIERAAESAPPSVEAEVAAVLGETAAEAVAPTADAPVVIEAIEEVEQDLAAAPAAARPDAARGRALLREAVLHQMRPLQALDARLFLAANGVPHPRWLDAAAHLVTVVTNGGWIWVGGALVAAFLGVPSARRALHEALPTVACVTWLVERHVKMFFRRRRPFIALVQALVIGKRPGTWSFPSGHTASSFAGAWVLSRVWPRGAPIFFSLASTVGFSRIYVGAHYPGDVLSGALIGLSLAALVRPLVRRLLPGR